MREEKQGITKGRVLRDTHTEDTWKGASKRMREQIVGEVEEEPRNACHVSLRGFQEDNLPVSPFIHKVGR